MMMRKSEIDDFPSGAHKRHSGVSLVLGRNKCLLVIALMAVGLPLIPAPISDWRWHGLRTAVFELGAVALLSLSLAQRWTVDRRKHWRDALQTLPLRSLVALLGWGCISALMAANKPFALQGLLQLGAGALITLTVASEARTRPQYEILLDALTGTTLLVSLSGFILYGRDHSLLAVGLYHDHQLYGAVFTVFLPIMLAISLSPISMSRRLLAQSALLFGFIAIGLAQARSSWIGMAAALLAFLGLFLWTRFFALHDRLSVGKHVGQSRQIVLSSAMGLCVLCYFLAVTPQAGQMGARLRTLTTAVPQGKEESVEWRFNVWQGARRMISQKPALGWGIGCYPLYQHPFTNTGHDASYIRINSPIISDEAHDSYLQIAVELGLPGLLLWLGVLVSTFSLGVSALRRFTLGGQRQWTLIGCLSALTGQAVDAVANPGWQFGEVNFFLWMTLGMTVALALGLPDRAVESQDHRPGGITAILGASKIVLALATGIGLLWLILHTVSFLPAPRL